ncbi:ABC transporter permease [Haloarcula nitratireducens]|uniref:ABC transporter permease n=1 Tax=Haloarcula nitratireducens TaxID=2487749 RepID=A0AAW4PHT7_9EURY|nr:ABC transporter permease [Halomicroarcula nitratireducens]MBX0297488.1 ABC transporter permease [Halomicroarcula nitratireducens]
MTERHETRTDDLRPATNEPLRFRLWTAVLRADPVVEGIQYVKRRERLLAVLQAGLGLAWMGLFLLAPLAYVLMLSFWQRGAGGTLVYEATMANYREVLLQNVNLLGWEIGNTYLLILWQSLKFGFITTAVTLVLGYVPGYFLGRSESRYQSLLLLLVVLPFWVPLIIRYYAWILVLGNQGLLTTVLGWIGMSSSGYLYNDLAVITGLVQVLLPFMILPIYNAVNKIDGAYIESAKTMGASPLRTFYEVTLPLSVPGISAGSILVFILAVGSFMAPALLGGPANMMVANLISKTFGQAFDWPLASAMAIVYLVVLFAIITVFNKFVGLEEVFE